jgi:hypothetical protein
MTLYGDKPVVDHRHEKIRSAFAASSPGWT